MFGSRPSLALLAAASEASHGVARPPMAWPGLPWPGPASHIVSDFLLYPVHVDDVRASDENVFVSAENSLVGLTKLSAERTPARLCSRVRGHHMPGRHGG